MQPQQRFGTKSHDDTDKTTPEDEVSSSSSSFSDSDDEGGTKPRRKPFLRKCASQPLGFKSKRNLAAMKSFSPRTQAGNVWRPAAKPPRSPPPKPESLARERSGSESTSSESSPDDAGCTDSHHIKWSVAHPAPLKRRISLFRSEKKGGPEGDDSKDTDSAEAAENELSKEVVDNDISSDSNKDTEDTEDTLTTAGQGEAAEVEEVECFDDEVECFDDGEAFTDMGQTAIIKLDVLKVMKQGTPWLKFGKQGNPHFRQFQISPDNQAIVWFSKGKSVNKTMVLLSEIVEIREGHTTKNFKKHKVEPNLERMSMSVIYKKKKSLDIAAKDLNEYRVWLVGLRRMVDILAEQGAEGLFEMDEIVVKMRICLDLQSAEALLAVALEMNVDSGALQSLHADEDDARMGGKKSLQKKVTGKQQRYQKKLQEFAVQVEKLRMTELYEQIKELHRKANECMDKASSHLRQGLYELGLKELYLVKIDLKALKDMTYKAKKHSKKSKSRGSVLGNHQPRNSKRSSLFSRSMNSISISREPHTSRSPRSTGTFPGSPGIDIFSFHEEDEED